MKNLETDQRKYPEMFKWLEEEIQRVNTPKFFLVDGPASAEFRQAVEFSDYPLPPSYRQFVVQFGNASLFRCGQSEWRIEIYAGPREAESQEGEPLFHFAKAGTSLAYFKEDMLVSGRESPIFEWRYVGGLQKAADSFPDWLKAKFRTARSHYKKAQWKQIETGPEPFNEREQAMVEARRRFRWQVVGIAPNGDIRFEVHNGSQMILPCLSIGIRGKLRPPKTGPLTGGAFLPVATIGPGETKIIEFDCYKKYVAPEDVEALDLPDPGPEDRDYYEEFEEL